MFGFIRLFSFFLIFEGIVAMVSPYQNQTESHHFQAPGEGDVRSPCPFLNVLANHGYVPRSGKNVTIPDIVKGGREGFNVGPNFFRLTGKKGLLTSPNLDSFNLDDLNLRGCIEMDTSLTRPDAFFAPNNANLPFNETVYQTMASSNPGVDYYNVTSQAQVQDARLNHSIANNPELVNDATSLFARSAASALILSILGDPKTGIAQKSVVDTLMREERMPDGWKRPEDVIDVDTIQPLTQAIMDASNWPGPNNGTYPGAQQLVIFSG
ncbi:hypothetical protein D9758_014497 [Tetrapyrgos nigripes]|uniref:Heme haloperoxidase family profile domain-containing protein n=1 Tax=Tetrapyrgos nigripes TaxID=182062 RepID=A0A8H5FGU6_9AGAR|nr:hypothetical protein D9758_014497 [Tetrapyrgos nigripes]